MPRYDYRCSEHDHEFELKQSFSSEPTAICPECGSVSRRVIHSVPVVFKGSGFYVNDHGKGGGSNGRTSTESEKSSDSKSESESETKSESDSNDSTKSESKKEPAAAK